MYGREGKEEEILLGLAALESLQAAAPLLLDLAYNWRRRDAVKLIFVPNRFL